MTVPSIHPYLFFDGRCEEALEFYKTALGAKIDFVMRYKESPEAPPPGKVPPNYDDKIMHASFFVGESMVMVSDGCEPGSGFKNFSLAVSLPTPADVDRCFAALSAGGTVTMPVGPTFFSPRFGMLTDKFGVGWMLMVPGEPPK